MPDASFAACAAESREEMDMWGGALVSCRKAVLEADTVPILNVGRIGDKIKSAGMGIGKKVEEFNKERDIRGGIRRVCPRWPPVKRSLSLGFAKDRSLSQGFANDR